MQISGSQQFIRIYNMFMKMAFQTSRIINSNNLSTWDSVYIRKSEVSE